VQLAAVGPGALRAEALEGLAVEVQRAPGTKCGRCWHFTEDVGADADWPEVCARCAAHVREQLGAAEPR